MINKIPPIQTATRTLSRQNKIEKKTPKLESLSMYDALLAKIDKTTIKSFDDLNKQLVLETLTHLLGEKASSEPKFKALQIKIESAISGNQELTAKLQDVYNNLKL